MSARYQHTFSLDEKDEVRLQAIIKKGKQIIDIIKDGIKLNEEKKANS